MSTSQIERLEALDANLDTVKTYARSAAANTAELRAEVAALKAASVDTGRLERVLSNLEADVQDISGSLGVEDTPRTDPPVPAGEGALSAQSGESEAAGEGGMPYEVPPDQPDLPGSDAPPAQLPTGEDGGGTAVTGGGQ